MIQCTDSDDPVIYHAYLMNVGSADMLTSLCENDTLGGLQLPVYRRRALRL